MFGYIYKITNLLNGKIYVGKHKYDKPELDPKYTASGTLINKSINKHGIQNFSNELICTCDSLEELNLKESLFILEFNSMYPNGYNLTSGGDGISNPSEEILRKNREWHLGKVQSEETIQKRINALKKVHHDDEWVNKISSSLRGRRPSDHTLEASKKRHVNTVWYNDGQKEYMIKETDSMPDNLVKGRLKNPFPNQSGKKKSENCCANISKSRKGLKWYNNGIKEIMLKEPTEIPEGFVRGRLKI